MARHHLSIRGLMGLIVVVSIGLASLRFASDAWAGVIVPLTLAVLTLGILGVVYRRAAARAFWLGFVLFGWGYMVLEANVWWDPAARRPSLFTSEILDRMYPHLHAGMGSVGLVSTLSGMVRGTVDPKTRAILTKLEEPVSMSFANETPLEDVLKYIKSATTGPNDSGIPIYVDPVGLQTAKATMTSPVTVDLEGVPLGMSLSLILAQRGLAYNVDKGLLTITAGSGPAESFRRVGHCNWALLLAWLGGLAGRAFHGTRDNLPEPHTGRD